jgi:signal transduction histidine kinase
MASSPVARHLLVTRRIEEVSGIRPITLLIASGIALIAVIMMVTGIAANNLRQQALATAADDLAGIDSVLAAAVNRSLIGIDGRLGEIAAQVETTAGDGDFSPAAAAPGIASLLQSQLGRFPRVDALALVATDGTVIDRAGTWPDDAARPVLAASLAHLGAASSIGAAIDDRRSGALDIPMLHSVNGRLGTPVGAVVALVPAAEFTSLFAAVPLSADAVISLLRPDGSVLARYPEAGSPIPEAANAPLDAIITSTIIRNLPGNDGSWRIEAVHPLPLFPAAVAVTRGADRVLAAWARQGLRFAAFALVNALAISIMVYLIARQFKTHALLAEMRADRIEAEKIESERARLAAEAELLKSERLSVLGQLTATVAHELRNPLSAIRNTLFTMKELATAAGLKLDRPVGRMERSIERCDRIISDLLEYTRNRELKRNDMPIDRWLAELLAEQPVRPPIMLTTQLGAAAAVVPIDADRFRRVVINLVENATQALAESAAERDKQITVRTTVVAGQLVLTVEDTGPGIAPDNLERIFEPLFSTKSFGTGLGLPTVKQIVNQHGGTIAVTSVIDRGTCVTVCLPLAASHEEAKAAA